MNSKRILIFVLFIYQAFVSPLWAATYYVDNTLSNSSDNNVGSQQAPWKNCPGMTGWTGKAVLQAGDIVKFNNSGTWTQSGTSSLLSVKGGVTYDGQDWGGGKKAIFRMLGTNGSANRPGVIIFLDDDATIETVVRGFEIDGNNKLISGITVNWPGANQPVRGAIKRIENCIIHDFGDPGGSVFGLYGIKVGSTESNITENVEILNTVVFNAPRSGITIYDALATGTHEIKNVLIKGCEVYNTGTGASTNGNGIQLKDKVANVIAEYNYLHDNEGRGIFLEDGSGRPGPVGVTLRYNIITNNATGGISFAQPAVKSADVYGNLIFKNRNIGSGGSGIYFEGNLQGALSVKIYNNTFFENANGEILISSVAKFTTLEIKNNILSSLSTKIPFVNSASGQITSHSNNIYYRPGGGTLVTDVNSYQSSNLASWEPTALASAPLLKNVSSMPNSFVGSSGVDLAPNTDGLSISADSPALDKGVALGGAYNGSINSVVRPVGAKADLGAYEYAIPVSRTLSGLTIIGPTSINESSNATYTATATWSDGSTSAVTPLWSDNSTYATISTGGVLTTLAVTANQTVAVSASYTSGGVTKTAANSVGIVDVPLVKTLSGLTISGPTNVNESSSGTYTATATWSDGSTSTVTPIWSENSTYTAISTGGVLTTLAVTANQTVTVSASYSSGGVTKTAANSVGIVDVPLVKTLSGLAISGPTSVNESSSGTYTATATWSDGSTSTVTPIWSENSTYTAISTGGVLTTLAVTANQTVTVSASYTSGGVTKTAANSVGIVDVPLVKTLSGLTISGPTSVNESSSGTYTATATWSDGSTSTVTPIWSENSTYTTISTGGVLTTLAVTANQTVTVSASYSSGGVTKTTANSVGITVLPADVTPQKSSVLLFRAESGALTAATMAIVSSLDIPGGSYITPTSSTSSSAVYDFNIDQPGTYKIVAEVYSADNASDSFLVKIDNNPEDVWDLNPKGDPALYKVWRQDEVTARGSGTFDAPQFDPLKVQLAAGPHKITISGRELNSRLAYFYLIMVPAVTKIIEAESGVLTAPMKVVLAAEASGGAYIASSTNNSGSVVYSFNIIQPGPYKIVAKVYVADAGSDSLLVKIDNGPEDIWDLNPKADPALYNVWRQAEVTARGSGAFDAPQFDPLTAQLAAGNHTITFSGRENNARLDNFYLMQIFTEPSIIDLKID